MTHDLFLFWVLAVPINTPTGVAPLLFFTEEGVQVKGFEGYDDNNSDDDDDDDDGCGGYRV